MIQCMHSKGANIKLLWLPWKLQDKLGLSMRSDAITHKLCWPSHEHVSAGWVLLGWGQQGQQCPAATCHTCGVDVTVQSLKGFLQGSTAWPCTPSLGNNRASGSIKERCSFSWVVRRGVDAKLCRQQLLGD